MSKSSGKDDCKKDKTLPEKLKQLFAWKKNAPASRLNQWKSKHEEVTLNAELLQALGVENPLPLRLKAVKDLSEIVLTKFLEDCALETIVQKTEDILNSTQPAEARQTLLKFYSCLIKGQFEKLNVQRAVFFQLIRNHSVLEDLTYRFEMFKALTNNGKCVLYFEEEAGPFLLEWMPTAINVGMADFLKLLINLIKYHAAYLDKSIVIGFVKNICILSGRTTTQQDIKLSLEVLDAVICYSSLPSAILPDFIIALCRAVNIKIFSSLSWKVMRNLLGTSMGHCGIYTMCWLIQDRTLHTDVCFLRGAVFFLGVALWGDKRVISLQPVLFGVLPSLYKVLCCDNFYVIQEVGLSIEKMIVHHHQEINFLSWEMTLDIIEKLLSSCDVHGQVSPLVHQILMVIEKLHLENSYSGSLDRLYDIIGQHSHNCPTSLVLRLLEFKQELIYPKKNDWIFQLNQLMECYFRNDMRSEVRIKVIQVLEHVLTTYRHIYEEILIDSTVLAFLSHIEQDSDVNTRKVAVDFLVNVAEECLSVRCLDILEVMEKVVNHPLEQCILGLGKEMSDTVPIISEEEFSDVTAAVIGLIRIFKKKLFIDPASHAVIVFKILTDYIQNAYNKGLEIEHASTARKMVLEFLLKLRANETGQIAIEERDDEPLKFSTTVTCSSREPVSQGSISPPLLSPTSPGASSSRSAELCISPAFQALVSCLKEEKDWISLQLVLHNFAKLLQNKAIVVCAQSSLTKLCSTLCGLVLSKTQNLVDVLRNTPSRFSRTDLHALIFPVLANVAAYSCDFNSHLQRMLIKSLEMGLMSKCARSCIMALTLCTLEMKDVMYKMLPEVLLSLSKISATITISVPVLEFLSNLVRLPELYACFVEDQYLIIFAIALPYTNPFKFHQYTVALAHHVIAMWYLKCRLPFRRSFVPFIVKGLRTNVVASFDCNTTMSQTSGGEGPKRQRSGSLNDPTVRRHVGDFQPRSSLTPAPSYSDVRPANDPSVMNLHLEMLETCLDLLGRYCFGTHTSLSQRSSLADFLFEKGKCRSMTWLVGHKLITVTTSGLGSKAYKDGLCEKCYKMCDTGDILTLDEKRFSQEKETPQTQRKRHKSAIQMTTRESVFSGPHTKDDMQIFQATQALHSLKRSSSTATSRPRSRLVRQEESCEFVDGSFNSEQSEQAPVDSRKPSDFICNCWCLAWADILIRRPTGNTHFLMRLQNRLFINNSTPDFPVPDISNWFKTEEDLLNMDTNEDTSLWEPNLDASEPKEATYDCDETQCIKSSLRRTNSSPDMKNDSENCQTGTISAEASVPPPPTQPSINGLPESVQSSPKAENDDPLTVTCFSNTEILNSLSAAETGLSSPLSLPLNDESCQSEHDSKSVKSATKNKLKLDLSTVNLPQTDLIRKSSSSPPPPLSASPFYTGGKGKSGPRSPLFKKGSTSPPPTSSYPHRNRGHTISVVSPIQSKQSPSRSTSFSNRSGTAQHHRDMYYVGVHPSYVFLELYQNLMFGSPSDMPLLLPTSEVVERAVKVLDHIPHYEAHKIGVIYVGPGQTNDEAAILSNRFGSVRYNNFLQQLGTLIQLKDLDHKMTYAGGLDLTGRDGKFACSWQEDIMQVLFHVATLMPNRESDPSCNNKKLHIGNDYVTIVYNNSQEDFCMSTVKGQFLYVCIIVEPKECATNVVSVKSKPDIADVIGQHDPRLVTDESLSMYVRQLALHANLASVVFQRQSKNIQDPYVSNWLERLRQLKRLRDKVVQELPKVEDEPSPYDPQRLFEDFTAYV